MSSVIHHKISKISKVSLNSIGEPIQQCSAAEAAHILRKHAGTLPLLWPRGHNITGVSQTTKRNCSFLLSACVHLSQANCLLCFHILFLSLLMSAFCHLCLTFLVLLLPQSFYSERKLVTCGMWGMQCLGIWSLQSESDWVDVGTGFGGGRQPCPSWSDPATFSLSVWLMVMGLERPELTFPGSLLFVLVGVPTTPPLPPADFHWHLNQCC